MWLRIALSERAGLQRWLLHLLTQAMGIFICSALAYNWPEQVKKTGVTVSPSCLPQGCICLPWHVSCDVSTQRMFLQIKQTANDFVSLFVTDVCSVKKHCSTNYSTPQDRVIPAHQSLFSGLSPRMTICENSPVPTTRLSACHPLHIESCWNSVYRYQSHTERQMGAVPLSCLLHTPLPFGTKSCLV